MTEMPYRDRVVDLTTELMTYKSTEDRPEEIDACMDHVAAFFEDAGLDVQRHRFDGTPSLVATPDGSKAPAVMFHGHIDVVPGNEQLFEPTIDGNKLQGRGSADMKGGVASMMHVLSDLQSLEDPPSIGMMVVSDEERGGLQGANALIQEGYQPEFCITSEPNNLDGYIDVINRQKGIIQLELTATGISAHAATPENGENAIEKLMETYPEIRDIFAEYKDEEWGTTVNYGRIEGGTVINQLPDEARLSLDVRFPKLEDKDDILMKLREISTIDVKSRGEGAPVDTDPENPYAQQLIQKAEEVIDQEVKFASKPHASDLRHFAQQGIPGVVFGPEAYGSHEPFEHLVIDSIDDYCQSLYQFGKTVTKAKQDQTISSQ
ncbi:M20/M25/M40 family metallo-hydrolase [Salinarchaeum sp. IM2453]|uniref:M20 family metallopeptidase n=1 Tax=Salinarchaeum sp. IM2453 TaxID=2862870 RepID=UPI001C8294C3|nr:M20/M25/M40 family metallo-hydrolase [Salinarchaeum sp. IM2453]QZA89216.1 M20/M25/M40 family metallo-hydrolase [Salinarchaeum sp. IM2453]